MDSAASAPKVTVVVVTYNHARWIAAALDSVLAQETTFFYDVIVIDDASTDGTRQILEKYRAAHPERIRLMLAPRNKCDNEDFVAACKSSQAAYIAPIDGDDYWTSRAKLQRLTDFLDQHAGYAICFHNALVVYEDQSRESWKITPASTPETLEFMDICGQGFIALGSIMFRRQIAFPAWLKHIEVADWAIYLLCAREGSIGFIDEVMSVFRKHTGGYWSSLSLARKLEMKVRFYRTVYDTFDARYRPQLAAGLDLSANELLMEIHRLVLLGRWKDAAGPVLTLLRNRPSKLWQQFWPWAPPVTFARRSWRWHRSRQLGAPVPQQKSNKAAIEGFLDHADCHWILGWVWNANDPQSRLSVEIRCDDNVLGTVRADRYRSDLVAAGKGDGYYAFTFALPTFADEPRPRRFSARSVGCEMDLPGSPRDSMCPESVS